MTIRIPEHLSIPQCPKCGMTLLDGGVRTAHHNGAHDDVNNVWPCVKLTMESPSSDELNDALMDHLCRVCSRCKFGWVEQVFSTDDIYAEPEPEDGPCVCDHHGDHLGCQPDCPCGGP